MPLKVCMFVYNNFTHDSRVLKEAKTLVKAGYDVRIIALLDKTTETLEKRDGFRVIRVIKDPVHYRMSRFLKRASRCIRRNRMSRFLKRTSPRIRRNRMSRFLKRASPRIRRNRMSRFLKKASPRIRQVLDFFPHLYVSFKSNCPKIFFSTKVDTTQDKYLSRHNPDKKRQFRRILKFAFRIFGWPWRILGGLIQWVRLISKSIFARLKGFSRGLHRPLCFLDYSFRSLQLVRDERADIYHAHDLNTLLAAHWARKKTGGKLIYDSHELYVERNTLHKQSRLARFLLLRFESFLIRRTDHVITVSESIAQELKRRYPVERVSVILNVPLACVRGRVLSLREELSIPADKQIVLYVGSITFNRGLEELIQSLAYMDDCVLVFMGPAQRNAYCNKLKQFTQDIGMTDRVHYFGPVPSEEVVGYAASAQVGAASIKNACLSYYYCMPNKLFEYMAASLPVVGSCFPEMKRVIEGYDLGKTFDPDDPKDIAEVITGVLSDKERYDRMRENALGAAKDFNWENESKKFLNIYRVLEDQFQGTSVK